MAAVPIPENSAHPPLHDAVLDHVACGVPAIAATVGLLEGELGGQPYFWGPGTGFSGAQWRYQGGGLIEILEPTGPPGGFLHRFLEAGGPRIHHVTYKIGDIRDAAAATTELGYEVVGYDDSNPGWKEFFVHPKQAEGIVVQLAESHPELDADWSQEQWPFPAVPSSVAFRIVGPRLMSDTAANARRLWQGLLGGRCRETDGMLEFSWKTSAMTVQVSIQPGCRPGPAGIRVAGAETDKEVSILGTTLIAV